MQNIKKALGDGRPNYNRAECFLEDRFGDLDFIALAAKLPAPTVEAWVWAVDVNDEAARLARREAEFDLGMLSGENPAWQAGVYPLFG